ncbi:MAG TPA: kelch repeat-containing protein [Terracidiphilus sp.]|nr:kelch repeat-containing protein [Terracidiphilus sp.]
MFQVRLPLRALLAFALSTAISALPAPAQTSATNQWTWMGGSSTVSGEFGVWPGVYGTKGTPAPANIPPTRVYEVTWTGNDGRFWLFGGSTFTTGLNYFNDLWVFDPDTNEWTWMAGDSSVGSNCPVLATLANCGQPGVYGTLGTPSPANSPGARESAQSWTDASGNLWLYGGLGFDAAGNLVQLDDLWEFDTTTGQWTWIAGDSTVPLDMNCDGCYSGVPPVPGTEGSPAAENTPGSLWLGTNWTDRSGNFWLFAGWGETPGGDAAVANELWKYSPSVSEWTWVGGSPNFGIDGRVAGIYGTLGTPAPANFPGTRWQDATWVDAGGNLWLFGGQGDDSTGTLEGVLNDLWEYDPTTGEWAWMGGSSTFNCADYPQKYCHEPGVYGTRGQPSAANIPGSRYLASSWVDNSGNLWLFGGDGFDSNSDWTYLNDLWEFNPTTNEWTWMNGSSNVSVGSVNGVYGTLGAPSSGNVPGIRNGSASWTDKHGNLWLWGGAGIDSAGVYGYENDLWRYQPASAVPPATTATPVFSPAAGTYTSAQSVTISDATSGAAIYYTADGTTPTTSSTHFTGPIVVFVTETIQAIATAPNQIQSAVASATYTIPANFSFALNPTSLTVQPGSSTTSRLTVQTVGGLNPNIAFTCSGLPTGASCSFALEDLPTPPNVMFYTLAVSDSASTAARSADHFPLGPLIPGSVLAVCFVGSKKRRWPQMLLLALCVAALGTFTGCSASLLQSGNPTSTVTVTGTSGSLSHSTMFTLTVN